MSRSFDLRSPRATTLPAGLERDIFRSLGLPAGRWVHVGNDIPYYGTVYAPPRDLARVLRQKGWTERALRAVLARLHTYHEEAPDHQDLTLSRRAFRHHTRQMLTAQRYDELRWHPHRSDGWWD